MYNYTAGRLNTTKYILKQPISVSIAERGLSVRVRLKNHISTHTSLERGHIYARNVGQIIQRVAVSVTMIFVLLPFFNLLRFLVQCIYPHCSRESASLLWGIFKECVIWSYLFKQKFNLVGHKSTKMQSLKKYGIIGVHLSLQNFPHEFAAHYIEGNSTNTKDFVIFS